MSYNIINTRHEGCDIMNTNDKNKPPVKPLNESWEINSRNNGKKNYSREPIIKNISKPETPTPQNNNKENGE